MPKDLKILFAEDEPVSRQNLKELLELLCDNVYTAQNGKEAFELYNKIKPDIVISDIEMPFLSGLDLAKKIREHDKKTQIIITTAYTDTEYFLKAIELQLVKYLVKPVKLPELRVALSNAIKNIYSNKKDKYYLEEGYFYLLSNRTLYNGQNQSIHLSHHEMLLFELLIKNNNNAVCYGQIEETLYDYGSSDTSSEALRTLVRTLRKKLPTNTIKNISKLGYKIELH